jgi:hypothetical protein
MNSHNLFQADVEDSMQALAHARSRSFFIKLFTLGLFNGAGQIQAVEKSLRTAQDQLTQYNALRDKANLLDDELLKTVDIQGIGISKNTFSDLPSFGHADYPANWEELRKEVLDRDNYSCQDADGYCDGPLQIHHIQTLSKGGSHALENLITICLYHHCTKHPHMMAKYYGNIRR